MMNKHGLGRGIEALIPISTDEHREAVPEIDIVKIVANPFQPRRVFDEEALSELALSIKQYGVLQPVVVRQTLSGYELVAGERRWRAAQLAGLHVIPAIVKDYTDGEMTEIALIENLQRENLNPIEEGQAYRRLMHEFGLTQEEVSQKIGRSRSLIANMVRLLNLPEEIRDHVSRGTISMGQARPLLTLESTELQLKALEMIIENDLSARDVEELVRKLALNHKLPEQIAKQREDQEQKEYFFIEVEDKLKLLLGTQVKIKPGKLKSKIEIEYYSPDDLERLLELFQQKEAAATVAPQTTFVV
ncbi:ParB family chromosome partitioning protein [Sporomusaceae bacterium BoRhaA]|uniref:ParB/RepB/Spo0J family partition protein n=1 Tax=Pelorhabdus rhamnosifermentans TaxID=2772457 RepID=UPI001C0640B7|nr:ParB/RepB/Spo0J family partition protein [Pelorhabdus rhamnosifermentans]MBU2703139.1 ParB family chromosome partitioning protein [Pelorhabdus rhamnosifermentans]